MRSFVVAGQRVAQREERLCLLASVQILVVGALLITGCSYLDEAGDRPLAAIGEPTAPGAPGVLQPSAAGSTAVVAAAAGSEAAPPVAPPSPEELSTVPALLSQTGLYSDTAGRVLAADVQQFSPAYPLWSDAAGKLRWISLPPGAQIDSSDMDVWKLPVGTKLWKEFEQSGHVIETRYMAKYGPTERDWLFIAYHWNEDQTDALPVPEGVVNADGSQHDIPSVVTCKQCHNAQPMAALGFSALQLSHAGPGLTLDELSASGRMTTPPAGPLAIPGDLVSVQALGYLHGNCGGCHNDRAAQNFGVTETKIVFWQSALQLGSLEQTSTYVNLVTKTGGDLTRLEHGLNRMKMRDSVGQMPPLGTKVIDAHGVSLVESWLSQLRGQLGR